MACHEPLGQYWATRHIKLRSKQLAHLRIRHVLVEDQQYPGINHNLDEASRCAAYPSKELSWDRAHCRYLVGWYYSGWPWQREYLTARCAGVSLLKTWAYDHICLFGWTLPLPTEASRPVIL